MYKISFWDKLSFVLVIIGAINWGLVGLLDFNLVNFITFGNFLIERIIYILIFVSAANLITVIVRNKLLNK